MLSLKRTDSVDPPLQGTDMGIIIASVALGSLNFAGLIATYGLTAWTLWKNQDRPRRILYLLLATSMFVFSSASFGAQAATWEHLLRPSRPNVQTTWPRMTNSSLSNLIVDSTFAIDAALADGFLLWRLQIFSRNDPRYYSIPLLLTFASIVFYALSQINTFPTPLTNKFEYVYRISTSTIDTILSTSLFVLLYQARTAARRAWFGDGISLHHRYTTKRALVIEPALIRTFFSVITTIALVANEPALYLPLQASLQSISSMTILVIIYRIARNLSFTQNTLAYDGIGLTMKQITFAPPEPAFVTKAQHFTRSSLALRGGGVANEDEDEDEDLEREEEARLFMYRRFAGNQHTISTRYHAPRHDAV